MASLADRLFDEVDRQLADVRAAAEAIAVRAAGGTALVALAAGLIAARIQQGKDQGLVPSLVALCLAVVIGFAVLVPQLAVAPGPEDFNDWRQLPPADALSDLLETKLLLLAANQARLAVMRWLFYGQMTVGGIAALGAIVKTAAG